MKNILGFLCSSESHGGLEMNVVRLAEWLRGYGYDVVVLCCRDTFIETIAAKASIRTITIPRHRKVLDLPNARNLYRLLKQERIATLFLFDNRDISVAGIAKTLSRNRLHLIYHQQMQIGVNKRDFVHTRRFSKLDRWLTPLNYLREEIGLRTRYDMNRVRIVPLGIDAGPLLHAPDKQQARVLFDLHPQYPLLGIMGRIDPMKGQEFLINAVHRCRELGKDIELVIVGEPTKGQSPEYIQHLHQLANRPEIRGKVHFRPFTADIAAFYAAIDVFAMATNGETYGMVTVEAMISGTPVIASRSPATQELLGDGNYGWLYQPDNVNDFVHQLIRIIEDPGSAMTVAAHAREEALTRYTHRQECALIVEELNALTSTED